MNEMSKISAEPDVITRMALGALRFVDPVSGQSVTEGLSVIARVRSKEIPATSTTRGVHLFHQLPGMSSTSFWDGLTPPIPETHEFNIEVRDTLRRFFSTAFKTSFPFWPEAIPICPEVTALGKSIPLFSAPWRLPRNDFAIIRGTLWSLSSDKPAAWALLRAYRAADNPVSAAPLVEGVADKDGVFMLMFPWPRPDTPSVNGPQGPRWTIRVQACYDDPDTQTPAIELPDGENKLPALCSILKQQPAKLLAKISPDPEVELSAQEMTPEQTLHLMTFEKKVLYLK